MPNLNIPHGTSLNLQFAHVNRHRRMRARLIGFLEGEGLIITAPLEGNLPASVVENDELVVRYVSGKHIYAFRSGVLKVAVTPYRHVHLSWPTVIDQTVVRNAERVTVTLPAIVRRPDRASDPEQATIHDLSATGAMLRGSADPGPEDGTLELEFEVVFAGQPSGIRTQATIRSRREILQPDGSKAYQYGVRFGPMDEQQALYLRGFVLETLILRRT